jgi:general secretion pathway protein C
MGSLGGGQAGPFLAVTLRLQARRLHDNRRMSARWWSLLVWSLVAASAVYWGLQLFARATPAPAQSVLATSGDAQRGDLSRLLGTDTPAPVAAAAAAEPVADNRYALVGVVSAKGMQAVRSAATTSRDSVALIAVDGKPAKAYRVGATVDGQQVLQAVGLRSASLGPRGAPAQVQLQIPPPADAARGVPAGLGAAPAALPGTSGASMPLPLPAALRSPGLATPAGLVSLPQAQGPQGGPPGMSPGMSPAGSPAGSGPPMRTPRVPSPGASPQEAANLR